MIPALISAPMLLGLLWIRERGQQRRSLLVRIAHCVANGMVRGACAIVATAEALDALPGVATRNYRVERQRLEQ